MSKQTQGHIKRMMNLNKICRELRGQWMTTQEIAALLKLSKDGVRPYIIEMRKAGVMAYENNVIGKNGQMTFKFSVSCDEKDVVEFLRKADASTRTGTVPKSPGVCRKNGSALNTKGRMVHILDDDASFMAKLAPSQTPPRHWMDRCLFGDGPAPSLAGL